MRPGHAILISTAMLVLLVAFLFASKGAGANSRRGGADHWDEGIESFVRRKVARTYVDELDVPQSKEAFYRAMKAYVDFDRYCRFYSPAETRTWKEETAGRYAGLGVKIDGVAEGLHVVGVLPGGPAAEAGLQVGDTIVTADGRPLRGMKTDDITLLLKGRPKSTVRVGYVRGPRPQQGPLAGEVREVVVTRDVIRPPSVFTRRVGKRKQFLHIRLTDFAEETADAFDRAMDKCAANREIQGVILDLRQNGGGVLGVAVRVADRFLRRGLIVRMEGRTRDANHRYRAAEQRNDILELPLVVLVNGGSASASEVVAGALQDHRRAVLVGQRTYGKFLVQSITEIPGKRAAVKLTTSRYYTPAGRSYQAPSVPAGADGEMEPAGLMPDVVIDLDDDAFKTLWKHWQNEEGKPWREQKRNPEVPDDYIDPHVEHALKLLEGEIVLQRIQKGRSRSRNG